MLRPRTGRRHSLGNYGMSKPLLHSRSEEPCLESCISLNWRSMTRHLSADCSDRPLSHSVTVCAGRHAPVEAPDYSRSSDQAALRRFHVHGVAHHCCVTADPELRYYGFEEVCADFSVVTVMRSRTSFCEVSK